MSASKLHAAGVLQGGRWRWW
ncbi:MAG: hypothetical protein RL081_1224, partial [Pseudomonadota bacterium]